MKLRKTAALLLALVMIGAAGLGESTMQDLRAIRKSAGDAIAAIETPTPLPEPSPTPDATPEPTPTPYYEPLEQGMKGEAVKRLQSQLVGLGYLKGGVDGNYGGKTRQAVQSFQQAVGLPATGAADAETQAALFAFEAPEAITYEALKYDRYFSDSAAYKGAHVKFSGTVMQVLTAEDATDSRGVYTVLRVATRKHAYDVVYVTLFRPADARAIAEGETVEVRGTFMGVKSYTSVSDQTVFLPWVGRR